MRRTSLIGPGNELNSKDWSSSSGLAPQGHVSLIYRNFTPESYNSLPQFGPGYREVLFSVDSDILEYDKGEIFVPKTEISYIDDIFRELPEGIRSDVFRKHKELLKEIDLMGSGYQDEKSELMKNIKQMKENINHYLEFMDLEYRLEEKKKEVVESFGKSMPLDSDIRDDAQKKYLETKDFWKDYGRAIKSDSKIYSRLKKVNSEFGMVANDLPSAILILDEDFLFFGDSKIKRDEYGNTDGLDYACLDKKALIKEVYKAKGMRLPGWAARKFLKTGLIMQTGEYPTLDRRKMKEITRDIIPTEEEKKREWSLGKKVLVGGIAATLVMPGVVGQIVKDDFGHYYKAGWNGITQFFSGGSSPGNQNNTEPPVLDNYSQWKVDHFGSLQNPDSYYARDPDHDYVDNSIEYQKGTNPTTPYTFKGLDDFNLLYTYSQYLTNISNRNLTQKEINQFLEKIPNIEPRHWTNKDGSAVGTYKDGKYINVSLRDPLVQYYANKTHIEWRDYPEDGKRGDLKLGDEYLHQKSGAFYNYSSMQPPAFYLANGRKGNCVEIAAALASVLVSKGYPCTICDGDTKPSDGKISYSHSFLESFIDGKTYIVNYGTVIPREDENGINHYEKNGWKLVKSYDPNWLENKNYNYI